MGQRRPEWPLGAAHEGDAVRPCRAGKPRAQHRPAPSGQRHRPPPLHRRLCPVRRSDGAACSCPNPTLPVRASILPLSGSQVTPCSTAVALPGKVLVTSQRLRSIRYPSCAARRALARHKKVATWLRFPFGCAGASNCLQVKGEMWRRSKATKHSCKSGSASAGTSNDRP